MSVTPGLLPPPRAGANKRMKLTAPDLRGGLPPTGLLALSGFFTLGAVIAAVTCIALLVPGGFLEPIWRLNPAAHRAFLSLGFWAVALMFTVGGACAFSAWGLWIRARWGHRLALLVLIVNLVGDALNALLRGDLRTLIGLPIGGALIAYLLSTGVRRHFAAGKAAGERA